MWFWLFCLFSRPLPAFLAAIGKFYIAMMANKVKRVKPCVWKGEPHTLDRNAGPLPIVQYFLSFLPFIPFNSIEAFSLRYFVETLQYWKQSCIVLTKTCGSCYAACMLYAHRAAMGVGGLRKQMKSRHKIHRNHVQIGPYPPNLHYAGTKKETSKTTTMLFCTWLCYWSPPSFRRALQVYSLISQKK